MESLDHMSSSSGARIIPVQQHTSACVADTDLCSVRAFSTPMHLVQEVCSLGKSRKKCGNEGEKKKREVRKLHSCRREVSRVKQRKLHARPVCLSSLLCTHAHSRNKRRGKSLPPAAGGATEQPTGGVGDLGEGLEGGIERDEEWKSVKVGRGKEAVGQLFGLPLCCKEQKSVLFSLLALLLI